MYAPALSSNQEKFASYDTPHMTALAMPDLFTFQPNNNPFAQLTCVPSTAYTVPINPPCGMSHIGTRESGLSTSQAAPGKESYASASLEKQTYTEGGIAERLSLA